MSTSIASSGAAERTDRARGVLGVAAMLLGQDLLQRGRFALLLKVQQPPSRPLFRTRGEEYLAFGGGEDNRALIAAFGDQVFPFGNGSLQQHKPGTNRGIARPVTRCGRYLQAPDGH